MNNIIFKIVANSLSFIAKKTGFSYNEINIIVYFFAIPFSWLCLLDVLFNFHVLKISFIIFCIGFTVGCNSFKSFSDNLIKKSVAFLNYFNKFGSNYVTSSVWICVTLPIVIYAFLIYLIMIKI